MLRIPFILIRILGSVSWKHGSGSDLKYKKCELFSSITTKIIYFYINIENIDSNEKKNNFHFLLYLKWKNKRFFVLCYFSLILAVFFKRRNQIRYIETDPEVLNCTGSVSASLLPYIYLSHLYLSISRWMTRSGACPLVSWSTRSCRWPASRRSWSWTRTSR